MSTYSTSSIPQGIAIYANATLFPVTAQDGEQAVAADTNTLYIYDTSVPGWQAVANPGAAIAIDALTGEVTATGPGVVAATITNAAVTNAKLAAMADNTVKGNKSGAPASPSDLALSSVTEAVSSVLTISNGSKTVVSAADLTIEVKQSSAVQSGYLSSADWSTFNSKQNALTFGNLTGDVNANISISGGTGAVIGAGASISQSAATALVSGYLSSTDWSTFNNKVSSVGASAPIASSGGTTPTISISQSGVATDGYLSSADWNTFNSKQPAGNYITALTSDVTATGPGSVAATVAFVGGKTSSEVATSVTDTQNATALSTASTLMERDGSGETALDGLSLDGSTSGAIKLQAAATTTNYTVKLPSAQGAASTFLQNDGSGNLSWVAPSSLPSQTGNQYKVLATDGSAASWQFAGLGDGSLGTNNIILGRPKPTSFTTANNNTIISTSTTNTITSAQDNVIIAGGGNALTSGSRTILVGDYGSSLTSGTEIVAIGWKSTGTGINSGSAFQSVAIGTRGVCGSSCVAIGDIAQATNTSVAIGQSCGNNGGSDGVTVGNSAGGFGTSRIVCVGSGAVARGGGDGVSIGYRAGGAGVGTDTGGFNTCVGSNAGFGMNSVSAARNVFLGYFAGRYNTNQADELFIDNRDRTNYANQQTNSLIYGTFNATAGSQTLFVNAKQTVRRTTSATNTVTPVLQLDSESSGTPANGIGVSLEMAAETAAGNTEIGVVLEAVTTDVTSTSEDFDLVVKNMAAGATAAETLRVASTGDVTAKTGNILIDTAGKGLTVKSGSNAKIGVTGAFPGGNPNTVTVSNTSVTSNSIILVSAMSFTGGLTGAPYVSAITASTSFVITVPDNSFTGTVGWVIVEQS